MATGPEAAAFEWGFSTKRRDVDTGLINFGRRHYHPGMGRWLSRDPIDEGDGFNLYAYVGNDPVNRVDPFGETSYNPEIFRRSILSNLLGKDASASMDCPNPDNEECRSVCGSGESQCEEDFGESIPEEPGIWDKIMGGLGEFFGAVGSLVPGFGNFLDQASGWMQSALGSVANAFNGFVENSSNWLQNSVNNLASGYNAFKGVVSAAYSALPQGVRNAVGTTVNAMTSLANQAVSSSQNWWNGLSPGTRSVLQTAAGIAVSSAIAVAAIVTVSAIGIPVGLTAAVLTVGGAAAIGGYKAYKADSIGDAIKVSAIEGAMSVLAAGAIGLIGKGARLLQSTRIGAAVSNAIGSSLGKIFNKLGGGKLLNTVSTAMRGFVGKAMKGIASSPAGRYIAGRFTAGGVPNPMRAGQIFEASVLAAQNLVKNNKVWRPTAEQIDSAAFKVIVGEARYTGGGLPKGTIMDSIQGGFLEIKGGSSVLQSTYQLRLQTFRSLIEETRLTIQTTRPVASDFAEWLTRWGVKVQAPPKVP